MLLRKKLKILSTSLIALSCLPLTTKAQIIPDNTLGTENSTINPTTIKGISSEQIDGGAIRGTNLFHSFEAFNIGEGLGAYFANPAVIDNIISRVTGNNLSQIMGTLGVLGDADLFLINPNGIVFGSNASLDLGGSFIASSASSVLFDGFEFSANNPQAPPLLTINIPIGLGFDDNPGMIINQSMATETIADSNGNLTESFMGLRVAPQKTLALIGGDISISGGFLTVNGGRIELGSVARNSKVDLIPRETGWELSYEEVDIFQDISLFGAAFIANVGEITDDIRIQGRNITLTEGSAIFSVHQGTGKAGNLIVKASESVELSGGISFKDFFAPSSLNIQAISGKSGNLFVETNNLILRDGANILADTFSNGDAGNINIIASESIELIGTEAGNIPSGLSTQVNLEATGDGGNINIETNSLIIQDGAQIAVGTSGAGKAGNLTIDASSIELRGTNPNETISSGLFASVEEEATGAGGIININTNSLIAKEGAQIAASTFGVGKAGNLTIDAEDFIQLTGTSATLGTNRSSGIFVSAQADTTGNVGELNLTTNLLTVEQGARISANNLGTGESGNATLNVNQLTVRDGGLVGAASLLGKNPISNERGNGGVLTINANTIEVIGSDIIAEEEVKSSLFTLAEGTGDAGNLNLFTSSLLVQDGGEVNVSSTGDGSAGNLEIIDAKSVLLDNGSLIAETKSGSKGNIRINAEDILLQNGDGSLISTNTQNSSGGNIFINTETLVAFDNSDITANAIRGQGGAIQITAEGILGIEPRSQLTPFSDITVFSQQSPQLDGVITIETSDTNLRRELFSLPTDIIDVTRLVAQGCPAGNRGTEAQKSQFILTGRGGVPPQPEETLRIPAIMLEDDNLAIDHQQQESPKVTNSPIIEANSWIINAQGKVVLTASVSPINIHRYWSNLAKCPDYPNY